MSRIASRKQLQQRENACVVKKSSQSVPPKILPKLALFGVGYFTQPQPFLAGTHLTKWSRNRVQILTSWVRTPRRQDFLPGKFRAGKFRAGKLRAKSELPQFKNCVVHPPGPPPAQPPGYRRPPPRLPTPPSCPPPAAHPLLLPPCCLHIRKKSLNTPR